MADSSDPKDAGRRFRHVLLAGDWHALWQTTVDGIPNINTEVVRVNQRGARLTLRNLAVSPENPIGGYLWRGQAALWDNHFLVGSYAASGTRASSQGTLYFVVNRSGDYLTGKWVGCNLDSNFTWGFGVLARDPDRGRAKLLALLGSVGDVAWSSAGPAGNASGAYQASVQVILDGDGDRG